MAAIEVENISKRYGTVTALDRVDFTVEEGEVFGFLGPNGAGKSTMINIFLDFVRPTDGHVRIFGHDCQTEGKQARERMGVLPEGYHVYERLTARQHLEFVMDSKGVAEEPMELLGRVGLRDAADRQAGGFSKGMAQRLVLAMALIGDPDLIVLDEPTTGLDPNGAREMRNIILQEADRGATVFFSSHILEQVEAVCDRVGILHQGELAAIDTIEGLRESVGGGTKLQIQVEGVQNGMLDDIETLEGVEKAWLSQEGTQVEVTCSNDAKLDVVVALNDAGVEVNNFRTEEASLEDMFAEYTGGSR
ncbi:ABC-2 type transport system ATP-binding protein [Halovenus aranensis]|jgi:ABC-2 type transport system ATP-binding protein|uniref:ABC-2 type transport system ATP-binding protein n=1 Tax=Halovenus aranensis TaxID=890420 RepID=A0A1G8SME2_9EURY|nr:ABC transporter ATP-binding protein [Halovenus aranensis]SDJ30333.1 ABC-2 type transport system ATP-binding protein [Halovenus aranensis]